MQLYELTVVLPSDEAKSKASVEKVEKTIKEASGKVVDKADWGKKNLSYPINKQTDGVYVLYQLELEEERVGGFNRLLQNDESILRHLLVKAEKMTTKAPEAKSEEKVETKAKKEVKSKKAASPKSTKTVKTKAKSKK
jgi:small subunit ribosomal protein S6